MSKIPAASRADLLRLRARFGTLDESAALFAFHREPAPAASPIPRGETSAAPDARPSTAPASVPELVFPAERPRLPFLAAVLAETLAAEDPPARGNPISDAELAVDWSVPGPPLPPLTRWARLAPFLRQRLGAWLPGARLDVRRLLRRVGNGLPVLALPRLPRRTWAAQAVVLWDDTPEMYPFARDVAAVLRRLRRERGGHGLTVRQFRRVPTAADLAGLPPDAPVLAFSAMGQFTRGEAVADAWVALARRLEFRGQTFHALNPAPTDRWQSSVATAWPTAVWDRRPRLPRRGGLRATAPPPSLVPQASPPASSGGVSPPVPPAGAGTPPALAAGDGCGTQGPAVAAPAVERLLDLLAPASRVEPPLLRAARLRLGADGNAGTEWDAWHHEHGWHSVDCFGFQPGPEHAARLRRRGDATAPDAPLAAEMGALMRRHHEGCSVVVAAEAELRACLSGMADAATLARVRTLLARSVDRLRLLAAEPGGAEGRGSGLPAWFVAMTERLAPEMRADDTVAKLIAQGLAAAHQFLETERVEIPEGADQPEFAAETRRGRGRVPPPLDFRVSLRGDGLVLAPGGECGTPDEKPLARLRVARRVVQLNDPPALAVRQQLSAQAAMRVASLAVAARQRGPTGRADLPGVPAFPASASAGFTLESDRQRLTFAPVPRPAWARRMWYDRHGLAADFAVGTAVFVLRWIPPGRFLMGSPDDEPGRWSDEGPQHEVTISRGFWLGETPVTQGQWRAVVEATKVSAEFLLTRNPELNPAPSHFQGPDALPVENVNWDESSHFCEVLSRLLLHPKMSAELPAGFGFRLPTEAQWEYACRAGTESALYTGGITIKGEHHAPELDAIAWYGGNSGQGLKVTNPYASKDWPEKQYPADTQAGTHQVKGKLPNAWGLYDTLGNVWEWCADAWGDYGGAAEIDPFREGEKSAHRVARGGARGSQALDCRAAYRCRGEPDFRWLDLGFRLVAGQEPRPRSAHRETEAEGRSRSRTGRAER